MKKEVPLLIMSTIPKCNRYAIKSDDPYPSSISFPSFYTTTKPPRHKGLLTN